MDDGLIDFYKHIIDDKFQLEIVKLIEHQVDDDTILKSLLEIMDGDLND